VSSHRFSKNATLPYIFEEMSTTYTESRSRVSISYPAEDANKAQKELIRLMRNVFYPPFLLPTLQLHCLLGHQPSLYIPQ